MRSPTYNSLMNIFKNYTEEFINKIIKGIINSAIRRLKEELCVRHTTSKIDLVNNDYILLFEAFFFVILL